MDENDFITRDELVDILQDIQNNMSSASDLNDLSGRLGGIINTVKNQY